MKIRGVISWLKSHVLIVTCLFVSAILIVVIQQRISDLSDLRAKVEESQTRVDKIHANTRASATLSEDLKKLDEYGTSVSDSLFDPSAKAANLAYVYGVGTKIGVVLTKVEQSSPGYAAQKSKKANNFGVVKFDIVAEGGIASIVKFITAVRNDHPLVRVERITISPSAPRAGTGLTESVSITFTFLAVAEGAK